MDVEPSNLPCVMLYAVEATDRSRQQQLIALADRLNGDGVETVIDLYYSSPAEGWPAWMERMAANRRILVACTELYKKRFDLTDSSGGGGVTYEARIVRQRLLADKGKNRDVIPIILAPTDRPFVPLVLRDVTVYDVSTEEGYEALYARLTGRELYPKPAVGKIRPLRSPEPQQKVNSASTTTADDEATRLEIGVSLERLLTSMRRVFIRGQFSLGEWQALHDDLDKRVRNNGARALGKLYPELCRALDHDQFAITYSMRLHDQYNPKIQDTKSSERHRAALVRLHDAYAMQNIATNVQILAPFLRELADAELATRLEYVATAQREIAERDLGDPRNYE